MVSGLCRVRGGLPGGECVRAESPVGGNVIASRGGGGAGGDVRRASGAGHGGGEC